MGALIPIILSLAPAIIKGVEKIFGPKTGPVKKSAAFDAIIAALQAILAKKEVPADMKTINDDSISAILELIVAQMNQTGELPKEQTIVGGTYTVQIVGKV